MADEETTRPVHSGRTPEVENLDGFKFVSFEQGEQVNLFVKNQRKRVPKRSFAGFGLTTLSLTKDSSTRLKKRNRKDDKRVIVDRIDGLTFVSAFTLNDFDEYDKNVVKRPSAPAKRKSTTKIEPSTSIKKVKKSECTSSENLGTAVNVAETGQSNPTPKELPVTDESVSSLSKKKNVSPLTKSALVRLKKISVSNLNKNSPMNKQIKDGTKDVNQKNSSFSKAKKSINLKVPLIKIGEVVSPPNTKMSKNSKIPRMQIDKPIILGGTGRLCDNHETSRVIISDDEDNVELDVCGIDETSSSQFILNNMNSPERKTMSDPANPKEEDKSKPKRKPCRVCCAYPCRIVGARRIKSRGNQFPSFDVSYTSRCQVHTPGEIEVNDPSRGKVNVNIQTTSTDIRMHLDFARRFPYRTISIVSCQPSLYDDDLKLPDNLANGTPQRCSENHRILEQKRREELHGLYCKLADTLSISKNRASKQWILENALIEVKSLEAKDTLLTAQLNSEKCENDKKRKRWEELAGKPYVAPKDRGKSKFMELYEQYRQEREQLKNYPTMKDEENSNSEIKNLLKEKESKLQRKEKLKKGLQKKIKKSQSSVAEGDTLSNQVPVLSPAPTSKVKNSAETPASSIQSSSVTTTYVGPETKQIQLISPGTLMKHASLGPNQIVRPFQHTPVDSTSASTPAIPKIDLTLETETSTAKPNQAEVSQSSPLFQLSQLLARNPNVAATTSNVTAQARTPLFKSPPPKQSSTLTQSAPPSSVTSTASSLNALFPTPIAPKLSNPSLASNVEYVVVTIVVRGKTTIFRIPKTTEGLTVLNKLSSLKILSPDSLRKIAAQFPVQQPLQLVATTTSSPTTTSPVTTTSLATTPATPTQWSAVASIPNPTTSVPATSKPVQQSIAASAVKTNANTTWPLKQPTELVKASSFATISRPIKEPIATTTVKTNSGDAGITSQPKQPIQLKTTKLGNSSDVSLSEKVKPFNAVRPSRVLRIDQTNSNDGSQQQKKLIFLDLKNKNKAEAKAFSVIPTSSSINVTLNKLGSITANKVFNKGPARMQSQNNLPKASFSTGPAPSASQTNRQMQLTVLCPQHRRPTRQMQLTVLCPQHRRQTNLSQVMSSPKLHLPIFSLKAYLMQISPQPYLLFLYLPQMSIVTQLRLLKSPLTSHLTTLAKFHQIFLLNLHRQA